MYETTRSREYWTANALDAAVGDITHLHGGVVLGRQDTYHASLWHYARRYVAAAWSSNGWAAKMERKRALSPYVSSLYMLPAAQSMAGEACKAARWQGSTRLAATCYEYDYLGPAVSQARVGLLKWVVGPLNVEGCLRLAKPGTLATAWWSIPPTVTAGTTSLQVTAASPLHAMGTMSSTSKQGPEIVSTCGSVLLLDRGVVTTLVRISSDPTQTRAGSEKQVVPPPVQLRNEPSL